MDAILTIVSTYWFTGTIGSSMRFYRENRLRPNQFAPGERVLPPLGVAAFPRDTMPPRAWVERVFDVTRWTDMPRGGHFGAMEAPDLLSEEIRAFFRPLRKERKEQSRPPSLTSRETPAAWSLRRTSARRSP
ncbi:alpha/beta fold hydrolase [Streptomyces aurantiacus]|uniref:alpha/beta fold hydrolase n=1 Tax=Streptomyces aurantiacus TaxID=47760 RepID=UPI00322210E9